MGEPNLDFAQAISAPDEQIDVALAALLYARDIDPDLDVNHYLGRLDDMARTIRPRLAHGHPIDALKSFLFDELGFRGNADDYFDPRNSFLNQVLDRRKGIPITLSVVFLELARRLDLPMVGIGLPGHFIVRYDGDEQAVYLDPFSGGIVMSVRDCRHRVDKVSNGRLVFEESFLNPVGPKQILNRMLRNLKNVYVAQADFESAILAEEKLILLNPSAVEEIRDLGVMHYYAGNKLKAIGCLEKYLDQSPSAEDSETVQHNLGVIIEKVARWN